jgi:hypothetical protein
MRLLHHYKDVTKINFERVQLTSELSLSKANKAFISPFGTIPLIRWFQLFHYTFNFTILLIRTNRTVQGNNNNK